MVELKVVYLDHYPKQFPFLQYNLEGDSGFDLRSAKKTVIFPGQWEMVQTGLKFEIQPGYEIQVRPRSGLAAKNGVTVLNSPGTVDSSYRGEIMVILINHSTFDFKIEVGDRIAQAVLMPISRAIFTTVTENELATSNRGVGGFGHTGVK